MDLNTRRADALRAMLAKTREREKNDVLITQANSLMLSATLDAREVKPRSSSRKGANTTSCARADGRLGDGSGPPTGLAILQARSHRHRKHHLWRGWKKLSPAELRFDFFGTKPPQAGAARCKAARASKPVESRVGRAEFPSVMSNGSSVHPNTTASQPRPCNRPITR
jgi:hypothetical protein